MTLSEGAEGSEGKFIFSEEAADFAEKADPAGIRGEKPVLSQRHIGRTAFSVKNYVGNRFLNSAGDSRFQARGENEENQPAACRAASEVLLRNLMKQMGRGDL